MMEMPQALRSTSAGGLRALRRSGYPRHRSNDGRSLTTRQLRPFRRLRAAPLTWFAAISVAALADRGCKVGGSVACEHPPFQGASALASLKLRVVLPLPGKRLPFQGASALASLKHPVRGSGQQPGLPFQGASALASLKHRLPLRLLPRRHGPFQGASALASLKRWRTSSGSPGRTPFQGASALASLKRHCRRHEPLAAAAFPGRERPGLIEARCSARLRRSSGRFPGRERPGLIEAQDRGSTRTPPTGSLSRARAPWPH